MSPTEFLRQIVLRSHKPGLISEPDAVLFSDQAQICVVEESKSPEQPVVKPVSIAPGLKIGPLPLAVTMPDGTSATAVVVSEPAAARLVQAANLISRFQE